MSDQGESHLPQAVSARVANLVGVAARMLAVEDAYHELLQAISGSRAAGDDVVDIARMIQELRVSLWAQQLGTARPVSEQRIYKAIDEVLA